MDDFCFLLPFRYGIDIIVLMTIIWGEYSSIAELEQFISYMETRLWRGSNEYWNQEQNAHVWQLAHI